MTDAAEPDPSPLTAPDPDSGRDAATGRFLSGNRCAVNGRQRDASRVSQIRSWLLNSITEEDLKTVVGKLLEIARTGSEFAALRAIELMLTRLLGPPESLDVVEAVDQVRAHLEERRLRLQQSS